ncbi:MAG: hypothetical protein AB7V22_08495 [Kiritimatiellia bacterium]
MNREPPLATRATSGWAWAWGQIALAGLVPFGVDLLRNFQLFAPPQLAWSFAAVLAGTSGAFGLGALGLAAVGRRWPAVRDRWAAPVFAGAAALIFAAFLYDANLTELRQEFGWPRPVAFGAVLALFFLYWAAAVRLGAKRTSLLLLVLLAFRAGQAAVAVAATAARGDDLVSAEEIGIYEQVDLARTPNVYFICLESYHGFGAMRDLYGFDNAEFREFLDANGFAVAEGTLANYSFTMTSLQSILQMGHHYAAGTFGNHDSLHARGFISGSGTYYNPALRILKRNGYAIVYLLPSDYYYRPGAGLVDYSLLERSWPFAPLKVSLPRFIGREPETVVPDYPRQVAETLATWPRERPTFFFIKFGAEHSADGYDYRTDRAAFAARYVQTVARENRAIEALCRQIVEQDPQGLVVLAGDHGAQSYKCRDRGFAATKRSAGIPAERLVRDCHDVLLAFRWGAGAAPAPYPYRSLVNVMRFVFLQLGGGEALRRTAARDSAYLLDAGGLLHVAEDGQALAEWPLVPRKGWQ